MMNVVLKTRNCVSKTRNFVFNNAEFCIKNEEMLTAPRGRPRSVLLPHFHKTPPAARTPPCHQNPPSQTRDAPGPWMAFAAQGGAACMRHSAATHSALLPLSVCTELKSWREVIRY